MASLTGQTIASTYDSLLKVSDNGPLTSTYKEIQDGLGNGSGIYIGTGTNVGIGTSSPGSKLDLVVSGSGTTLDGYNVSNGSVGAIFKLTGASYSYRALGANMLWAGGDGANTYIGTSTNNYLALGTNAFEYMRIATSGNIGIGVTNPLMKLDLYGTSGLPATSGTTPVGSLRLHASNNAVLDFGVDNGTANGWIQSTDQSGLNSYYGLLLNPRGGNVGIGTSNPSTAILHLNYNSVNNRALRLQDANGIFDLITSGGGQNHSFGLYDDTNGAYRLFVTPGGNVGIGTTSVFSKFQVHDGKIQVSPASNADGGGSIYGFNDTSRGFTFEGGLRFQTFNWNGSSYAMRDMMTISGGGNVGIGTTSPAYPLQVNGLISSNRTSNTDGGLVFGTPANGNYFYGADSGNYIATYTANSERMRITSGGNVGIGTTNPSTYKLHVEGGQFNVKALSNGTTDNGICYTAERVSNGYAHYFVNSGNGVGSIYLNASSTSFNTSSDYRLKEDLKEINGLDKLSKLKVYDFKWKNSDERMDGVLAHELAEVLPYAVTGQKDGEQMQAVDYSKIVPVLVKALQELTEEVNQLKNK